MPLSALQSSTFACLYSDPFAFIEVGRGGQGVVLKYVGRISQFQGTAIKVSLLRCNEMVHQAFKEMHIGSLGYEFLVAPTSSAVSADPRLLCMVGGWPGDAVLVQNMEYVPGEPLDAAVEPVRSFAWLHAQNSAVHAAHPAHPASCQTQNCAM